MKTIKFNTMLDAWRFIKQNSLRCKPKRIGLYEWHVNMQPKEKK